MPVPLCPTSRAKVPLRCSRARLLGSSVNSRRSRLEPSLMFGNLLLVVSVSGQPPRVVGVRTSPHGRMNNVCDSPLYPHFVCRDDYILVVSRSEEHTSELQSRHISYAVFCLKKKNYTPL